MVLNLQAFGALERPMMSFHDPHDIPGAQADD